MKFLKIFKLMQTGFFLLLMISLFASFVDLTEPAPTPYFFIFYILVLLFVLNLGLYVVKKVMTIIKLLRFGKSGRTLYRALGVELSLFAVHLGVALIFFGNILDLSLGYNGHIELRPGETVMLPDAKTRLKLADFQIDYYKDGSPSQYTSKVLISEKDQEIPYDITVNHPLDISGSKLYQESYGWLLNTEISENGKIEKYLIKPGQKVEDGVNKIKVIEYIPHYIPREMPGSTSSPAVMYYLPQKNITGVAKLGEKVQVSDASYLTFIDAQAITVLKVKTSPGLPFVEAGGALLAIGVVLVFLFRDKRAIYFSKDVAN